jgi:predicted nucleic acid-binding protein
MPLSSLFARIVGRGPEPKWVVVLDTSVLVPAVLARGQDSPNVRLIRAAVSELFDCVLSDYIREEAREVLQRPEAGGHSLAAIEAKLAPLWTVSRFVEPLQDDDASLASIVGDDVDDAPVFATALAAYQIPELAARPTKMIVSNNIHHFKPGQKPHGIEFQDAIGFWRRFAGAGGALAK